MDSWEHWEHWQYYDGLNWEGIVYNDHWLIVISEAAFYCDQLNEEYIRYSPLKTASDEMKKMLSDYKSSGLSDSAFNLIIHSGSYKKYFSVKKVSPKETRIIPRILVIQNEISYRRRLNDGKNRLAKLVKDPPFAVDIKDSRRSLFESVQISEGLRGLVTYANSKKERKII